MFQGSDLECHPKTKILFSMWLQSIHFWHFWLELGQKSCMKELCSKWFRFLEFLRWVLEVSSRIWHHLLWFVQLLEMFQKIFKKDLLKDNKNGDFQLPNLKLMSFDAKDKFLLMTGSFSTHVTPYCLEALEASVSKASFGSVKSPNFWELHPWQKEFQRPMTIKIITFNHISVRWNCAAAMDFLSFRKYLSSFWFLYKNWRMGRFPTSISTKNEMMCRVPFCDLVFGFTLWCHAAQKFETVAVSQMWARKFELKRVPRNSNQVSMFT